MPYTIYQNKGQWCIKNSDTGESKGCSDSKEKAVSHLRVLNAVHHGWKPTGKSK